MKVELIYSTPNYHKLVETVARVCYQSYHKDDVKSHNFIKAIMAKGHISIASVGNMVFEIDDVEDEALLDLLNFQEITNFVKWSFVSGNNKNHESKEIISMNMLTFLEIYKLKDDFYWSSNLLDQIIEEVNEVPCLKWFYDKSVELPETANEYTAKGIPKLYDPIVLDEDYTALKELGLNEYELGIHSTITMNFITDRSASLQFWRHWSGGCELSQRYVGRGSAEFREMIIDDLAISKLVDTTDMTEIEAKRAYEYVRYSLEIINYRIRGEYDYILSLCEEVGIRKGRAKEIARSVLPNSITTQCIQSRPYRNWKHLFELRDSKHAQREIQEDVIHMKRVLNDLGVPTE